MIKTGLLPQLTYEHLSEIPVNVRKIDYVSLQQRGTQVWDIANDLPTPPDVAMRRYVNQRFKPVFGSGILKLDLQKAQITRDSIPNQNKLLSYVPFANNEDYTLEIVLNIESLYQSGIPDSQKTLRLVRKIRMPLNVTVAYREAKLQRTVEEIIRNVDEVLIQTLIDEFNLISRKNRPQFAIEAKTEVPEVQTKFGQHINNFEKNINSSKTEE